MTAAEMAAADFYDALKEDNLKGVCAIIDGGRVKTQICCGIDDFTRLIAALAERAAKATGDTRNEPLDRAEVEANAESLGDNFAAALERIDRKGVCIIRNGSNNYANGNFETEEDFIALMASLTIGSAMARKWDVSDLANSIHERVAQLSEPQSFEHVAAAYDFLGDLKARGVRGVCVTIADDLSEPQAGYLLKSPLELLTCVFHLISEASKAFGLEASQVLAAVIMLLSGQKAWAADKGLKTLLTAANKLRRV